jgi:DNA-binding MarR family transcriptional regulator
VPQTTPTATTPPEALDLETAARLRMVIGRLSRRLRSTAAAREAGLTPTKISVLLNVARTSPMRLADLAAAEGLNPTLLSRVTSELVARGLLERSSDPHDRRAAWVGISRAGRRLAERMRSERTEAVNAAMAGLSAEERRRLQRALPALEALAEELRELRP